MATMTPVDYDPFAGAAPAAMAPSISPTTPPTSTATPQAPSNVKLTPVDHDPFAPTHDWDKVGLTEPEALKYINGLPEDQRDTARNEWGDKVVNKTWQQGSQEGNALEGDAYNMSAYIPGAHSWMPRLAGSYRYLSGHDYEMGKALEKARMRKIESLPSPTVFSTPYGDISQSDLQNIAGGIGSAAVMPMARFIPGEALGARAGNMALNSAGYGAVEGAGQGETAEERLGNAGTGALIGGIAGPAISEGAGLGLRTAGAMGRIAGREVAAAHEPQLGADRALNSAMKEAGTTPEELAAQVIPTISKSLSAAGMTQDQIGEFVRRGLAGESPATLATEFGLSPSTVSRYINLFKKGNPTPLNMMDLTDLAKGQGAALPMTRESRSAFIISRNGEAAQNIIDRQLEQPGRVADIVQQSGGGKHFDERLKDLQTTLKAEEDAAYTAAKKTKAPVDIAPILSHARAEFPATGEAHNDTMNKAIDLFYSEGYVPTTPSTLQQAQYNLAIRNLDRGIAKATKDGDMGLVNDLQLKKTGLTDQLNNSTRHSVTGPVSDVDSFLKQRRKLDDMIDASKVKADTGPGQKNTNLTRDLMGLRKDLNGEFAAKNPAYAAADAKFSGNRTTERLLNQGADMALSMKANRYLARDFGKLTPSQQELVRVGFEQNIAERALGKQDGAAVANQFQTPAFKQIVDTLYPKGAIAKRGQNMLENLKREAITTRTKTNIFANSNTGQTTFDLNNAMRGAYTAAHAMTGDVRGVLHDVQKWAARQIGQRQATKLIQTLSETDPAKMLDHLERLGKVAKSDKEAEIYRDLMRSTRRKVLERAIVGSGSAQQVQPAQ